MGFLRYIRQWGKKVVFLVNKADILASQQEQAEVCAFVADSAARMLGVQGSQVLRFFWALFWSVPAPGRKHWMTDQAACLHLCSNGGLTAVGLPASMMEQVGCGRAEHPAPRHPAKSAGYRGSQV